MQFSCKTRIYTGRGSVDVLKTLGSKKLLLVTDPFFAKNGVAQKTAALASGAQIRIFDRVAPDPSVELVAQGVAMMQEFQPDTVVALGGGSAMDCAKAMVYLSDSKARLVAIPTTSGSGSEVTDFAIITAKGIKQVMVDDRLQPDMAIVDGDFVMDLPASLVADAGFDVLAHALEALAGKNAGAITDALAMDSFCTAFSQLGASYAGEKGVRQAIHTASTMAGLAFSGAGLGLCHAMSHTLGGLFHIPHGRLNAILLPGVIGCNASAAGEKYAALARRAGLGGTAQILGVRNLKNALVKLRSQLQLPGSLPQAGVSPAQVAGKRREIIQAVLKDPCCATNPVPVTAQTVESVLNEVTGLG